MEDYSSAKLRAKLTENMLGRPSLNLDGKGLSRVPDAVTELSEVEEISLTDNNLTELPSCTGLECWAWMETILLNYLLRLVT